MKGRWLVASGCLAIVLGAWAVRRAGEPPVSRVQRGDLVLAVEAVGVLEAVESSDLGPPAIGDLWDFKISFLAPEGAEVKAGQAVVAFDTSQLDRALAEEKNRAEQAAQELAKRTADLDLERLDLELRLAEAEARRRKARLKAEVPADLAANHEVVKARAELEMAEAEVGHVDRQTRSLAERTRAELSGLLHRRDLARGKVESLEHSIAAMRVVSPRAGTVVYLMNWRGEKKKVGDPAWRAEKIVSIPDLSRLRGVADIAEVDAGRVRVGQRATIRLDALPDRPIGAEVRRVGTAVQRQAPNNPARIVKAELDLGAIDAERMRPGMRFRIEIERERATGVLLADLAAIEAAGGVPHARRRGLLRDELVEVRLGRRNAAVVEVLAGLAEGDALLLPEEGRTK